MHTTKFQLISLAALLGGMNLALADGALPQPATVVVTATRVAQSGFDLPVSIDSVNTAQIQDMQPRVNLSEALARVPGVVAQNRQNYAQDLQISSRGFGARSTFGVRGLRLYADGIPATMPDGQGQVSNFDLGSAARIEVLRGPFSALYGNSSGGVISLFSEEGKLGVEVSGDASFGSNQTYRAGLKAAGDTGSLNYVASAARFHTDGYRAHSAVTRDTGNAVLRFKPDADSRLTLVGNTVDMPEAQDPLGLNRTQFDANPRQADPSALNYNTRKKVAQTQGGAGYETRLSASDTLAFSAWSGQRKTVQFQSITPGAQTPSTNPGGVIDLGRSYGGVDARWTHRTTLADSPLQITAGVNHEFVDEDRRGYENFIGAQLGVQGNLRRNEANRVTNFDQYAQAEWQPAPRWTLHAGLRHSEVKVVSNDHYTGNGDDSGSTRFAATNPVMGAAFKLSDTTNLYASYGRGFETPTLNELSYRPASAGTGLNFSLQPATSRHLELGAKSFLNAETLATLAVFHVDTRNEIVVLTNSGGRSVFQNASDTQRDGVELSIDAKLPDGFAAYAAYTWLRARYADSFLTCPTAPPACTKPTANVAAGNAIPGIPATSLYADLTWSHAPTGFKSGLELRQVGQVYVNDVNNDAAPAYRTVSVRAGFEQRLANGWRASEFLRVDNLSDAKYAGSVIVNEGNGRYFEPAPGRTTLLGVALSHWW